MNILIFNCGSSSQGFKVYQTSGHDQPVVLVSGKAKNVATQTRADAFIEWKSKISAGSQKTDLSSHRQAAGKIIAILKELQVSVDAIGHRFVHGGTFFDKTVQIDPPVLQKLQQCLPFAPIHNPNSYSVIEVCLEQFPDVPQFAVFDTAFHARMPEVSKQYAIPRDLVEKYGYYKYGFHGLSYQYVSSRMLELMGKPLEELKLILCHLGTGGSSVVAMKNGLPLDTSMGYSPLAGLVMSTRSGDIDPEIVLEMIRNGSSPDEVSQILNNRSGLIGLSGFSSSLPEIIEASEKGNADCQLAYDVYAHRLETYLGAYTWLLDGADAIVFTDDVGLKSWKLRAKVCGGVQNLGVEIDAAKNVNAPLDRASRVSSARSKTQIWVMPTDEESVILQEILAQFCLA
ncbi:acetate kinase [Longilinea arvoryzae]|uniref:Acetate kinase n=1 Tax=Longilinea arvoryzae TaxID=360412 RepID=A0A0S7BN32_9CHLR|nr:acetate/propionate family kinase [Longilinea arvoryzae]GAP15720.1 acetate kinase [Longilinea arvoryzae]